MKEFITAADEIIQEDESGKPPEEQTIPFVLGHKVPDGFEDDGKGGRRQKFRIEKRTLHARTPNGGQLAFMLASMGRGQTNDQRFAAIVNIMLNTLVDGDQDYFESRLLSGDPHYALPPEQIEEVFEYLSEQWFGRPTQPSSDSASSPPSDGQN